MRLENHKLNLKEDGPVFDERRAPAIKRAAPAQPQPTLFGRPNAAISLL